MPKPRLGPRRRLIYQRLRAVLEIRQGVKLSRFQRERLRHRIANWDTVHDGTLENLERLITKREEELKDPKFKEQQEAMSPLMRYGLEAQIAKKIRKLKP